MGGATATERQSSVPFSSSRCTCWWKPDKRGNRQKIEGMDLGGDAFETGVALLLSAIFYLVIGCFRGKVTTSVAGVHGLVEV